MTLSEELYDNEPLLADSRPAGRSATAVIGDAAAQAQLSPVVEDYIVFHIASFAEAIDVNRFHAEHGQEIAQILRAERRPLSEQEVSDAFTARISYGMEDLTIVDWNAALLIDRDGDDIRAVLEYANVELLEMRYLDQKLDRALDQAYDTLSKRAFSLPRLLGYYGADLRSVAELQVDNAILFEGVNNTLKLLGDQYLARVYRLDQPALSPGRMGRQHPAKIADAGEHLRKDFRSSLQPAHGDIGMGDRPADRLFHRHRIIH